MIYIFQVDASKDAEEVQNTPLKEDLKYNYPIASGYNAATALENLVVAINADEVDTDNCFLYIKEGGK